MVIIGKKKVLNDSHCMASDCYRNRIEQNLRLVKTFQNSNVRD